MVSEIQKVLDDMESALAALRSVKPEERSEEARRIQVTITDFEKVIAYYKTYVIEGGASS